MKSQVSSIPILLPVWFLKHLELIFQQGQDRQIVFLLWSSILNDRNTQEVSVARLPKHTDIPDVQIETYYGSFLNSVYLKIISISNRIKAAIANG